MKKIAAVLDRGVTVRSALLVASVIVFLCGSVFILSIRGQPGDYVRFEQDAGDSLAADKDIAASITFDRDSYFLGEHAVCRVRILYRPAAGITGRFALSLECRDHTVTRYPRSGFRSGTLAANDHAGRRGDVITADSMDTMALRAPPHGR